MTNQLECEIRDGRVASLVRIFLEFPDLRDRADPGVFSRPSTDFGFVEYLSRARRERLRQ